jgi:hypothetical protein
MLNQASNLVNDVIDVERRFLSGCLVHERTEICDLQRPPSGTRALAVIQALGGWIAGAILN